MSGFSAPLGFSSQGSDAVVTYSLGTITIVGAAGEIDNSDVIFVV